MLTLKPMKMNSSKKENCSEYFKNAVWIFFENLSVLVPYIILNVMDVFLPEVIFVSDKGLHHLNTWTILKDQGWLGGIDTKCQNLKQVDLDPLSCHHSLGKRWEVDVLSNNHPGNMML